MIDTIVTTAGEFSSSQIGAISLLLMLYPDAEVLRVDPQEWASLDLINTAAVGLGGIVDPMKFRFDYTIPGWRLKQTKPNAPIGGAGLVWRQIGPELLKGMGMTTEELNSDLLEFVMNHVNIHLISSLDVYEVDGVHSLGSLARLIDVANTSLYSPALNSTPEAFYTACSFTGTAIMLTCLDSIAYARARNYIGERIDKCTREVLVLDQRVDWSKAVANGFPTVQYVVAPTAPGQWEISAARDFCNKPKYYFPDAWAGLSIAELKTRLELEAVFAVTRSNIVVGSKTDALTVAAAATSTYS